MIIIIIMFIASIATVRYFITSSRNITMISEHDIGDEERYKQHTKSLNYDGIKTIIYEGQKITIPAHVLDRKEMSILQLGNKLIVNDYTWCEHTKEFKL